jgi:hypothetical protein
VQVRDGKYYCRKCNQELVRQTVDVPVFMSAPDRRRLAVPAHNMAMVLLFILGLVVALLAPLVARFAWLTLRSRWEHY